jgi:hypothetical protein
METTNKKEIEEKNKINERTKEVLEIYRKSLKNKERDKDSER